jgi:hypothetical protein
MFGTLVCEICEPELSHAAKALELGGVDEPDEETALIGIRFQLDDVVDGIPIVTFHENDRIQFPEPHY